MVREYGFDTNPGNTIFLVITGVTNPSSLGFLHVSTGGDPLAMTIPLSHSTAMTATDQLSSTSAGATEVTYAETFASTGRSPTALRNRGTEQFGHGARDFSRGPGPPGPREWWWPLAAWPRGRLVTLGEHVGLWPKRTVVGASPMAIDTRVSDALGFVW